MKARPPALSKPPPPKPSPGSKHVPLNTHQPGSVAFSMLGGYTNKKV